jgi:hypothetical protein
MQVRITDSRNRNAKFLPLPVPASSLSHRHTASPLRYDRGAASSRLKCVNKGVTDMSPFLECAYLSWLTPSVSCRLPEYIFRPVPFALPVQCDRSQNLQLVYESLSCI